MKFLEIILNKRLQKRRKILSLPVKHTNIIHANLLNKSFPDN